MYAPRRFDQTFYDVVRGSEIVSGPLVVRGPKVVGVQGFLAVGGFRALLGESACSGGIPVSRQKRMAFYRMRDGAIELMY